MAVIKKAEDLDKAMRTRIKRMADRTWSAIGADVLHACGEGESATMSKTDVLEVVADSDAMATYGADDEAYQVWKGLENYDEMRKAISRAFPYKYYGF